VCTTNILSFTEDIEKRRRQRQRRAKEDKRRSRYIEDQERKKLGIGMCNEINLYLELKPTFLVIKLFKYINRENLTP